jgi:hypothetical protein
MDTKRRPFCRFWIGPTVCTGKYSNLSVRGAIGSVSSIAFQSAGMLKCTSVVFAILPLRTLIVPWMTGLCVVVDRAEEHASRESLLQPDMNFSELRLPCFRSFSRLAASGNCATPLPTAEWIGVLIKSKKRLWPTVVVHLGQQTPCTDWR